MALTLKILTVIIVSRVCEVISYVYVVDFFYHFLFQYGEEVFVDFAAYNCNIYIYFHIFKQH